jgi:hypothetical protein
VEQQQQHAFTVNPVAGPQDNSTDVYITTQDVMQEPERQRHASFLMLPYALYRFGCVSENHSPGPASGPVLRACKLQHLLFAFAHELFGLWRISDQEKHDNTSQEASDCSYFG